MSREGLIDDTGYQGFDYEPPCENCKNNRLTTNKKGELCVECCKICNYEDGNETEILLGE